MRSGVRKEQLVVNVDGESIAQEVYVDEESGLDIDSQSGVFRTREETEAFVKEVYRIGRDAMPSELERYNKWMNSARGSVSTHTGNMPAALKKNSPSAAPRASRSANDVNKTSDSAETRLSEALRLKEEGNFAMTRGDYRKALSLYARAVMCLTNDGALTTKSTVADRDAALATLHANQAQALIHLRRFEQSIAACDRCLALHHNNVKALFRLGVASVSCGQTQRVAEVHQRLQSLLPNNDAAVALRELEQRRDETVGKEVSKVKLFRLPLREGEEFSWILNSCGLASELVLTLQRLPIPTVSPPDDQALSEALVTAMIEQSSYMRDVVTNYIRSIGTCPAPAVTPENMSLMRHMKKHLQSGLIRVRDQATLSGGADESVLFTMTVVAACIIGLLKLPMEMSKWKEDVFTVGADSGNVSSSFVFLGLSWLQDPSRCGAECFAEVRVDEVGNVMLLQDAPRGSALRAVRD